MIVPVRCFSCGKVVGSLYEEFVKRMERKENPEKALTELGIDRYCCRRMLVSHVELIDEIAKYNA